MQTIKELDEYTEIKIVLIKYLEFKNHKLKSSELSIFMYFVETIKSFYQEKSVFYSEIQENTKYSKKTSQRVIKILKRFYLLEKRPDKAENKEGKTANNVGKIKLNDPRLLYSKVNNLSKIL
jgi:hypothetical protein